MTGQEILKKTFDDMMIINPADKIIILYKETMKAFQDFEVLDSFYQIKKNEVGEGLAWEMMFFNKKEIVDLVVTRTSIDCSTILIKQIISVNIVLNYTQGFNEKNEIIQADTMTLSIVNMTESNSLFYSTETSKHSEFLRLRNGLLTLIS